ncbi:MAG: ATP synthase subunit I [Clostridia bacterium]|nr:ATP synthase subunit I [Clostridia bacterium]
MNIDPIVKKETGYMALGSLICTAIVAAVFLLLGNFDLTVALGCLVGFVLTVGNFFVMSNTLTKAIATGDEVTAKLKMKQSYVTRSVVMLVVMGASIVLEQIHWVPVIASVFYPRIIIFVRGIAQNIRNRKNPPQENPDNYVKWEDDGDEEEPDEFEKFVGGFSKTNNNTTEGK